MILCEQHLPGLTAGHFLLADIFLEQINLGAVACRYAKVRLIRPQCLPVLIMKQPAVPPPNSPTWVMIGGIIMVLCAFGFVVSILL
jgi:hypothetical protein